MAKNIQRSPIAGKSKRKLRTTTTAAATRTVRKNRTLQTEKTASGAKTKGSAASTTSGEKKTKKRVPQRSMSLEDLVPGPLPEETKAPQQSAIPRKIRL